MSIQYQSGYKYQLVQTAVIVLDFKTNPFTLDENIETDLISLNKDGMLIVKDGYAWDGPSGPTIDTKNFMRGSLFHDALYQLMREDRLDRHTFRIRADTLLREICLEDGMSSARAWFVYWAVRKFGDSSAIANKNVIIAP